MNAGHILFGRIEVHAMHLSALKESCTKQRYSGRKVAHTESNAMVHIQCKRFLLRNKENLL